MTDPLVTLRIDNDNNGYINTNKNPPREQAEIELQEKGIGKPITFWGVDDPFGPANAICEFVPMDLEIKGGAGLYWYMKIPEKLVVYHFNDEHGGTFERLNDFMRLLQGGGYPKKTFYVKAVGASAQTQTIEIELYAADRTTKINTITAKASFAIQDNSQNFNQWIVPNAWKIESGKLTTPVKHDAETVGPQVEGTERGTTYDSVKKRYKDLGLHQGDAFTRDSYDNGFTLKLDYSFTKDNCLRPDTTNGDEKITADDEKKLSFVANSGVKVGPRFGRDVFEVAIIDVASWAELAEKNDSKVNFTGTKVLEPYGDGKEGAYADEELSTLLSGVIYDGQYESMKFLQRGASGKVDALATLGAFQATFDNSSMVIEYRYNPNKNEEQGPVESKVEVYMKTKPGADPSNYGREHGSYPTYHLVYGSDEIRESRKKMEPDPAKHKIDVPPGDAYIRLQSHWGSGVTFTTVEITPH